MQKVDPSAGEDGIDAESSAVAVAKVEQTVDQSNEASQTRTVNGEPSAVRVSTAPTRASQYGDAFALAVSDQVSVEQHGPLKAGQDGIRAVSRAEADATVDQDATQNGVECEGNDPRLLRRARARLRLPNPMKFRCGSLAS